MAVHRQKSETGVATCSYTGKDVLETKNEPCTAQNLVCHRVKYKLTSWLNASPKHSRMTPSSLSPYEPDSKLEVLGEKAASAFAWSAWSHPTYHFSRIPPELHTEMHWSLKIV
eukprot:1143293-Pelagomonas_calceolata.AAC.4